MYNTKLKKSVRPISNSQSSINAPNFKKWFLLPRTVPSYPTSSIIIGYLPRLPPAIANNRSFSKLLFHHQRTNSNGKQIQPSGILQLHSNKYNQANYNFTTLKMSHNDSPAKLSQNLQKCLRILRIDQLRKDLHLMKTIVLQIIKLSSY